MYIAKNLFSNTFDIKMTLWIKLFNNSGVLLGKIKMAINSTWENDYKGYYFT